MIFDIGVHVVKRKPLIDPRVPLAPPPLPKRSLSLAKQCVHLGEALGPVKEGCGPCGTLYHCAIHQSVKLTRCTQECADWKAKPDLLPLINHGASKPREPIRFDHHNFLPHLGGVRLNPSIMEYEDGYLFTWRHSWGNARTRMTRLDKNFAPVGDAVVLNLTHVEASRCQEDARLFYHQGKLHVWYTGYRYDTKRKKWIANTLVAKLGKDFRTEYIFHPHIPNRNEWEKNNSYFDHQGELYCVYSIAPHRVHKTYCEQVQQTWETTTNHHWQYGHLRGGASPSLHNGEYYHWFHGMTERGGGRLYTIGIAVFEAQPPFRITRITHDPIDIADPSTNPKPGVDVLFPCGAIFVNGQWVVSMGVHDKWTEIRFYDSAFVESSLSKV